MSDAAKLKTRLKKWHITQLKLGEETGRDRAAISRQLSGEARLTADVQEGAENLIRIARNLQIMTVAAGLLSTILIAAYQGDE